MFLFIDTNSLYRLADFAHGLDILNNLFPLVKERKVILLVSKQLTHEYVRNIYSLKNERIKSKKILIERRQKDLNALYELVRKELGDEEADKLDIKGTLERFTDSIQTTEAEAEKISKPIREKIDELFSQAVTKVESQEVLQRAQERVFRGDPPFPTAKNGRSTGGDAINWEFLLEYACDDDLAIVSKDGDYGASPDEVHPVLQLEWEAKSKKRLKRYDGLGSFVNDFTKADTIDPKEVKEEKELVTQATGVVDMCGSMGYFSPSYGFPIAFDTSGLAKACEVLASHTQAQNEIYAAITPSFAKNFYSSDLLSSIVNVDHVAEVLKNASVVAQNLSIMQSVLTSASRGVSFPWDIRNPVAKMMQGDKQTKEEKTLIQSRAEKEQRPN